MPTYPSDTNDTVLYTGEDIFVPKDSSVTVFEDARMFLYGEWYLNGESLGASSSGLIDVRAFGAVGDGVTNDTAALQAAINNASMLAGVSTVSTNVEVHFMSGRTYVTSSLVVPARVHLVGHGARISSAPGTTGVVIHLLGEGACMTDFNIFGQGSSGTLIGVRTSGQRNFINHCFFDQFAGSAIVLDSVACAIIDCFAQNCLLNRNALSGPTGVVHLNSAATDCWIARGEFTASCSTISAGGFAYAIAILSDNNSFDGFIAEISDHGIYCGGSYNKFSNCRADLNQGHGWVLDSGGGDLSGCESITNGRAADNTYDGFYLPNSLGGQYNFSSCSSYIVTGNRHRYGFNILLDSANIYSRFSSTCSSSGHGTAAIKAAHFAGAHVDTIGGPFWASPAGSDTIDLQIYNWPKSNWSLYNTSPQTITWIKNGVPGMSLNILGDGNTTFQHAPYEANLIRCKSETNTLALANTIYQFVRHVNGIWYQV